MLSRAADVINGQEIIRCLSEVQSQLVFVPVTPNWSPLFILRPYGTLTLSTNEERVTLPPFPGFPPLTTFPPPHRLHVGVELCFSSQAHGECLMIGRC